MVLKASREMATEMVQRGMLQERGRLLRHALLLNSPGSYNKAAQPGALIKRLSGRSEQSVEFKTCEYQCGAEFDTGIPLYYG